MTDKQKTLTQVKSKKSITKIVKNDNENKDKQIARLGLSTTVLNTSTVVAFTKRETIEVNFQASLEVMREKVNRVKAGNLNGLEATLTAQTVSLDAIFNELARRAANNMNTNLPATESYLRLALKAQSQCARTIEVLAAMKNPPVLFAKQANISHGNQQVNNGSNLNSVHTPSHVEKTINPQNELLTKDNHATLDASRTTTPSRTDKTMATVAT